MTDPLTLALYGIGVIFCITMVLLGITLFFANTSEVNRNLKRAGRRFAIVDGEIETKNGDTDYRVSAGMAFVSSRNQIVPQGRLSREAINSILE